MGRFRVTRRRSRLAFLNWGAGSLLAFSDPGLAASSDAVGNLGPQQSASTEQVYITARPQFAQAEDAPLSLSIVDADSLAANDVTSVLRLNQLVPSLQVLSFNPRNTSITIRGLGANIGILNDGIEPGVGVYVDGVLYARPGEALFDLPDIESIDVLRGPQGTLYGKNAVAGAVNINTRAPQSVFEAGATLSIGSLGYRKLTGTVSGPIQGVAGVRARLSGLYVSHGGSYDNRFTGSQGDYNDYAARGQVLYEPTTNFSLRVIADYESYSATAPIRVISGIVTTLPDGEAVPRNFFQRSAAAGYSPLPIDPYARKTDTNAPIYSRMKEGGVSAEANWSFGGSVLTSITAIRSWTWRPSNDDDLTALSILNQARWDNDERQVSQEIRIASPIDRAVSFNGGFYYLWEQDDGHGFLQYGPDAPLWVLGSSSPLARAALNDLSIFAGSNPRINSYAAFGEVTWHIVPKLDLTGGLRFTYEEKTGSYVQDVLGAPIDMFTPAHQIQIEAARASFAIPLRYDVTTANDLTGGLAALAYHVSEEILTYFRFAHGEKSAGLNLANLVADLPKVVAPESVNDYEVGIKSSLFDGLFVIDGDVFSSRVTNYQTSLLDPSRFVTYLANIPAVRSRGVELDAMAHPFEGLSAHASAAFTDAIYESYPNAPAPFEDYAVVSGKLNSNVTVDLSDRPLAGVSRWAFSVGAEYAQDLGPWDGSNLVGYLGVDESYRSSYFSQTSLSIYSRVPGYEVTNLRIGLRPNSGRWDVQLWARNLFDRNYKISQVPILFNSGALSAILGDPRTIGGTFAMRF